MESSLRSYIIRPLYDTENERVAFHEQYAEYSGTNLVQQVGTESEKYCRVRPVGFRIGSSRGADGSKRSIASTFAPGFKQMIDPQAQRAEPLLAYQVAIPCLRVCLVAIEH